MLGFHILFGLGLLLGRLAQIQLLETEHFSKRNINLIEASVNQRTQTVILDNGRGKFYDRNNQPLNYKIVPSLVLFPFLKNMVWDAGKIAEILGVNEEELLEAVREAKEPVIFGKDEPYILSESQMKAINALEIPGVFAVNQHQELKTPLAAQLIGLVRENFEEARRRYPEKNLPQNIQIGISGLQKSFDEFLLQEEVSKLVFHVDGKGGPLFGIDVKYVNPANPFYPIKVNTTLDLDIQKKAEEIVDTHGMQKGGLILMDIKTNSILALVSRPQIDGNDPFKDEGAKNFMVTASVPGSIFKTVIAAAAIDYNLVPPSRQFDCTQTIHGEEDEYFDHGIYDFTTSFAASCNFTFGTLAKELAEIDKGIIENYATKLGLLDPVAWQGNVFHYQGFRQIPEEEQGQVFLTDKERQDPNFAALTGIGQKNVRITPLQAVNMMATIARGGKKEMVRVVDALKYKNGTNLFRFPQAILEGGNLSPYTAMKLQHLLREVVTNSVGTGRALKDLPYTVAGKSGTAETGLDDPTSNKKILNHWFVGYFPFEEPKYALVVVHLEAITYPSPIPIFQDMVKFLYDYDQQGL